jgi:hypothetical protein
MWYSIGRPILTAEALITVAGSARSGQLMWKLFRNLGGMSVALTRGMSIVYCDQKAWRVVRAWSLPGDGDSESADPVLGDWCATLMKNDEQSLLIVVNIQTLLTTVLPVCPAGDFPRAFKAALHASLEDLNVDKSAIASAIERLHALELKRLARSEFGSILRYVEYFCGIELMYHTDLRRVQRNLNDLPHAMGVPASEVPALFARGATYRSH